MNKNKLISFFSGFLLATLPMSGLADWELAPDVFEPVYYADQNADVEKINGYDKQKLIDHWLENGLKEGRRSSPVLDVRFYLAQNPDLAKQFGQQNYREAAHHWHTIGRKEGRPSHPQFSVRKYLENNPDVARRVGQRNYEAAIDDYLEQGYQKGLNAN
jgi:hypothetical protein